MLSAIAFPALAEVGASGPSGFIVTETAKIAASPDQVYAVLIAPARWWSADHTFSRSASNLRLEARAGGCWCEDLPSGGSVEHLHVVYADPGKTLRLRGALGPLQSLPADGVMTWSLAASDTGTDLKMTYAIFGDPTAGLETLAQPVDQVLGEQVERLKAAAEGGQPGGSQPNGGDQPAAGPSNDNQPKAGSQN
jgi:uncharacterized protein YndB with AHSA1/START domain